MAHGSLSAGRDSNYLISKVGTASGEYYGVSGDGKGEREGEFIGSVAAQIGLTGTVDSARWEALVGQRKDPTHPDFADAEKGAAVPVWGNTARTSTSQLSIDQKLAEQVAAAVHPLTVEEVAALRLQIAKAARTEPALYNEFTFSAQKSVSAVQFVARLAAHEAAAAGDEATAAMWAQRSEAILNAVDAGANAAFRFIEQHAGATRAGRHPGPDARWVDAGFVGAGFLQTTSQDGDPQIHKHMPILPRTIDAEGQVRAVDTMGVRAAHRAAAEHGNRVMVEQIAALDWGLHLIHGKEGIEIAGISQAEMDMLSSRSKMIRPKVQKVIDAFRQSQGRAPSPRELHKITQYATKVTRGKAIKETETEFFERLVDKTNREEIGVLAEMAGRLRWDQLAEAKGEFDPDEVCSQALFEVQTGKASWDRFDLYEKVAEQMPAYLGMTDEKALQELYWGLVDHALQSDDVRQIGGFDLDCEVPVERQRADGTSQFVRAKAQVYVTVGHMDAEGALMRAATSADRMKVTPERANAWIDENASELSSSQRAALYASLTEGAAMSQLVGPAGTGKSYVLGKLAQAWPELTGGRVIGLATTERATNVLRDEGLGLCANVSSFLIQAANGGQIRPVRGDFVILDESSMTDTVEALAIQEWVEAGGAQWAATGDPEQLGSVNAGGWFKTAVERGDHTHTLEEVMRFEAAWEGPASLALRAGDESAVREYGRRGRIVACGTPQETLRDAADRYVTQRLLGRVSIVTVATNADAAIVASHIRERFVELGYTSDENGIVQLGRDDNAAGVGDMVMCRRNEKTLGVTNRNVYRLTAVKDDGSVEMVDEQTGHLVNLPAVYVEEDAQLGYASTAHAAEGVTVTGEAITVVTPQMGREALYVGLTRSKTSNVALVSTVPVDEKGRVLDDADHGDAEAIVADRMQLERAELSAHDVLAQSDFDRTDAARIQSRLDDHVGLIGQARLEVYLDRLVVEGVLTAGDRERFTAEADGTSLKVLVNHIRIAEQSGLDPEGVLRSAVGKGDFGKATNVSQVTTTRITRSYEGSLPAPDSEAAKAVPKDTPEALVAPWEQLTQLAEDRHRVLGSELADDPPQWATDTLGPVPDDPMERIEWEDRAGRIGYTREIAHQDDETQALGRSPGVRSPEARAAWHEGHDAAGRPEDLKAESEMSEGQLRVRAKAAERVDRWAPDHVDGALQAAATAFYAAEKALADGVAAEDPEAEVSAEVLALELKLAQAEWEAAAQARDEFMDQSSATREAGRRAEAEMRSRGLTKAQGDDLVTADEYLADREAERAELEEQQLVAERDVREAELEQDQVEHVEPAVDSQGQAVAVEVVQQPDERETDELVDVDLPDDLARARSLQAATAAAGEAAYLRAQANAYEGKEAQRRRNQQTALLPPAQREADVQVEVRSE